MKVKIEFTVDVTDDFRRALNRYEGRPGLATREDLRRYFRRNALSLDDDVMMEAARCELCDHFGEEIDCGGMTRTLCEGHARVEAPYMFSDRKED